MKIFYLFIFLLFVIPVLAQNNEEEAAPIRALQRSYDEFTGETLIIGKINGPISFVKTILETGEIFIILKWESYSDTKPESEQLKLIILFDDNTRLSINLPIVCKYDEFWSTLNMKAAIESETIMDPTMYSLNSEVILNSSQIAILKDKIIKKYRLGRSSTWETSEWENSKLIFNNLLKSK
ncbi:hypothetical protein NXY11_08860 [Parabacteroides faecis]|uniref:hypothetical protein n=1 Tax=Parabacteroides faecis TaxID=1217282 RepID=UPI0021649E54|nr:hypothetical protein [Parabacteroides faecis]MCS2893075.1 hypothetical protein [Parabacteroides faecis]UVQ48315.1 hypothetical protein NXY11_08860 [Parabacteroides faecis]